MKNNTAIGEYLTHFFGNCEIAQRSKDGYIDATSMCKVKPGKKIAHWRENKTTSTFLEALSSDIGIPISSLCDVSRGGASYGGSWIHPYASIHLAMWISPIFAIKVIKWTSRFISGDLTLVHDLVDRHEAANPGAQVRATLTTAGPSIDPDAVNLLHSNSVLEQENTKLKVRIAEIKMNASTGEEELHDLKRVVETIRRDLKESQERASELENQVESLEDDCVNLRSEASSAIDKLAEMESDRDSKRRRLGEVENELSRTLEVGRQLYKHHLITRADLEQFATQEEIDNIYVADDAREQRDAGSKPVRYRALRNVNDYSNGEENRLIRDLNRNTFDSLGQNLTKYSMSHHPSRAQKMKLLCFIMDIGVEEFDIDRERTPYSSVSWRCLVYKTFKRKYHLQYSTYTNLRTIHGLTRRANTYFAERGLSLEFHLTEQRDLEVLLGLEQHPLIGVAVKQCDIRHFMEIRPDLALEGSIP